MDQPALQMNSTEPSEKLFFALELSGAKWQMRFGALHTTRAVDYTIDAGDLAALWDRVQRAREKLKLPDVVDVECCYEAGRDGFWLARLLSDAGARCRVLDSSSIQVDRRQRRAKTDGLDVAALLQLLLNHARGITAFREVVVPPPDIEDERRIHRERERLRNEINGHMSRIRSLLALHGIRMVNDPPADPSECETPNGGRLPPNAAAEIKREMERLELARVQMRQLEKVRAELVKKQETPLTQMVATLMQLKSVGIETAWMLTYEFFGWRRFRNRREVGSCAGIVPTPYNSGGSIREQGISKAGNRRIRALMVELAWMWLRYQPESATSKWFTARFTQSGRSRKCGIVAMARRLLVDLWRYATQGVVPTGADMKLQK